MERKVKTTGAILITILIYLVFKVTHLDIPFFWDTVAGLSRPAHYLYEHGLFHFNYPSYFVAEPPLSHFYIASSWLMFGKSLTTTHLSLALIGVLVIIQTYLFASEIKDVRYPLLLGLIFLIEPTFTTQLSIVSTDIFLLLGGLLALRGTYNHKSDLIVLGSLILVLTSLRGFATCAGIGLFYYLSNCLKEKKFDITKILLELKKAIIPFLPALMLFAAFLVFRKIEYGAFFVPEDYPWKEHRQLVGPMFLIHNIISMGWIFLDYGKFIIWFLLFFITYKKWQAKEIKEMIRNPLFLLFISITLTMAMVTLPFSNPFSHRYFMLSFMLLSAYVVTETWKIMSNRSMTILTALVILLFATGHLWVYPEKKSQAWDASFAHLPYYNMEKEMTQYLKENNISTKEVGVFFPMDSDKELYCLDSKKERYAKFDSDNPTPYLVYSNVFNLDSPTIDNINHDWIVVHNIERKGIFLRIYKHK